MPEKRKGIPLKKIKRIPVSKPELYLAYRKAKSDLFHENYQAKILELADYEANIDKNIANLWKALQDPEWVNGPTFEISPVWVPKIVSPPSRVDTITNSGFLEWDQLATVKPEFGFKPIADASIDVHVVSALWILKVGECFDSSLSKNVYGSRVPRVGRNRLYNKAAVSSFSPYPSAYRKWRKTGIEAMRTMVAGARDASALTWDFSKFFQNIDPKFIVTRGFRRMLSASGNRRLAAVSPVQWRFTSEIVEMLSRYSEGLPVGVTASAVLANMVLFEFDQKVESTLSPVYYGRYMDDVFLVMDNANRRMRNAGDIRTHVVEAFNSQAGGIKISDGADFELELDDAKYAATRLMLNPDKQRYFLADHGSGTSFLDIMETALEAVSSERRFLPDKSMTTGSSARAMSLPGAAKDNVDLMGGADHVALRRMGLANVLGACRFFNLTFAASEWAEEREWLVRACVEHVFPPHQIFELIKYVPRIVAVFASARDWDNMAKVARSAKRSLYYICSEAAEDKKDDLLKIRSFYYFMCGWMIEEAVAAVPMVGDSGVGRIGAHDVGQLQRLVGTLVGGLPEEDLQTDRLKRARRACENVSRVGPRIYWSDLGYVSPSSQLEKNNWKLDPERSSSAFQALCDLIPDYREGASFVGAACPPNFLMFPTRRISSIDICRLDNKVPLGLDGWKKALRFGRGTNWKSTKITSPVVADVDGDRVRVVSSTKAPESRNVAVVSAATSDRDWSRSVSSPNRSRERYERLSKLINGIIESDARPHYVLFPELSVPIDFADIFGQRLAQNGMSSVMGVEYRRPSSPVVGPNPASHAEREPERDVDRGRSHPEESPHAPQVANCVHLYLVDSRLGYPTVVFQTEEKGSPAIHEREELRRQYGAVLSQTGGRDVPVYYHDGVAFAVLICSELTNLSYRSKLSGAVDILFVPAWNQDLPTFSALVEASSLDMHCYVVMANNRRYGDSRIRGPYKDDWKRDLVRLRGGIHDYFAVGTVLIEPLRAFQSNHVSPESPFKPTPDGFGPKSWRKSAPWRKG